MNFRENIRSARPGDYARRLPTSLLLLVALSLLLPAIRAQDEGGEGAPVNLDVEVTAEGIVLNWDAPTADAEGISGYEIAGSHVRRGAGVVESVTGSTDDETTTWLDEMATDPELLYVYRVRALRNGDEGPWSAFVITEIDDVAPAPTIAAPAPEPTAALPEPEPTEVVPVAPSEPTAAPPPPEPTSVPVAPPLPEPTRVVPVAPVEPTTAPQQPEPTTAPAAVPAQPTAAMQEPEPTASA